MYKYILIFAKFSYPQTSLPTPPPPNKFLVCLRNFNSVVPPLLLPLPPWSGLWFKQYSSQYCKRCCFWLLVLVRHFFPLLSFSLVLVILETSEDFIDL